MLHLPTLQKMEDWLKVRLSQSNQNIKDGIFQPDFAQRSYSMAIEDLHKEILGKIRDVKLHKDIQSKTEKVEEEICHICGHRKKLYRVTFTNLHVRIARILFEYCVENKTHIVKTGDIAKKMTHTDYVNFASLQRFGLMYYIKDDDGKRIRGQFGVPLKRLHKFLTNSWQVAEYFWRDEDEATNEHSERRIWLHEVKKYEKVLDPITMLPYFVEFQTNPFFQYDPWE